MYAHAYTPASILSTVYYNLSDRIDLPNWVWTDIFKLCGLQMDGMLAPTLASNQGKGPIQVPLDPLEKKPGRGLGV